MNQPKRSEIVRAAILLLKSPNGRTKLGTKSQRYACHAVTRAVANAMAEGSYAAAHDMEVTLKIQERILSRIDGCEAVETYFKNNGRDNQDEEALYAFRKNLLEEIAAEYEVEEA